MAPRNSDQAYQPESYTHAGGPLRVWDWPIEGREYVIGGDPARDKIVDRSKSRISTINYQTNPPDFYAAVVIELETARHVATWHTRQTTTSEFADVLAALGWTYNTAELVVERDGAGGAAIDRLINIIGYPNVFSEQMGDGDAQFGFFTEGSVNRGRLIMRIEELVNNRRLPTRDEKLLDELRVMQIDPMGKPRAMGGDHDDIVMALGLALIGRQARLSGKERINTRTEQFTGPDAWFHQHLEKQAKEARKHERNRHRSRFVRRPRYRRDGTASPWPRQR